MESFISIINKCSEEHKAPCELTVIKEERRRDKVTGRGRFAPKNLTNDNHACDDALPQTIAAMRQVSLPCILLISKTRIVY